MVAIPLLYYPLFPTEEFETPKTVAFITFGCFSFFAVYWSQVFKDKVAQALLLLLISAGISTIFSTDTNLSIYGNPKLNNGIFTQISYLVFYLAATQSVKTYADRLNLIRVIVAVSFVVTLYAIAQVTGHDFKAWNGVLSEHGFSRPMSSLGHPNFMAAYLAMTLPFATFISDFAKSRFERMTGYVISLLTIIIIFFSQSRGMWWAAAASFIVYKVMIKTPIKKFIKALAIVILLIGLSLGISKEFRDTTFDRASRITEIGVARAEYLKGAIRIWKRYPFIGSGTDTFELAFQHQRSAYYWVAERSGSPHRAHNEFLNILATQGLLGALAGALLTFMIFLRLKTSKSPFIAPIAASIIAFYVQEISSFHVIATGSLFIICLSLLSEENYEPRT